MISKSNPAPVQLPNDVRWTQRIAIASLLGLICLLLAWELWLAPLRPGGSWVALKALPLIMPLAGLVRRRLYTYRWVSLLVWLYFTEGVVRAWSDLNALSRQLAMLEIVLCLCLFVAVAAHVRLRFRHARQIEQATPHHPNESQSV